MQFIRFDKIKEDSKQIPDGVVFTTFMEGPSSAFLITEVQPNLWAFAFKMKGEIALSAWRSDDCSAEDALKSKKQILFAKRYGWSYTGEKKIDEDGVMGRVYHCLYCNAQTQEVNGPCTCRGIETKIRAKPLIDFLD